MKAINIIDSLCYMGNTESIGIVEYSWDLYDSPRDFYEEFFSAQIVDDNKASLKPGQYLYSYGDKLSNSVRTFEADIVLQNADGIVIFLYSIN